MVYIGEKTVVEIGNVRKDSNYFYKTSKVYYEHRLYGNLLISGRPGTGKSAINKHILVNIYKYTRRKIVIFDVYGEYINSLFNVNYESEKPSCMHIEDANIIRMPSIKISDMISPNDWRQVFGMSESGSNFCYNIAEALRSYHQDDPYLFKEALEKLPSDKSKLWKWNEEFGDFYKLSGSIHKDTVNSIITKYNPDFFYCSKNSSKKTYVSDFTQKIKEKRVTIFFLDSDNLDNPSSLAEAGFIVGHILERMIPDISKLKPLIVCDEADYLFSSDPMKFFKSTNMGTVYVTKFRKRGVSMIYIVQNVPKLHPQIYRNVTNKILFDNHRFESDVGSNDWMMIQNIKSDLASGRREGVYVDLWKNSKQYFYFTPKICCCKC